MSPIGGMIQHGLGNPEETERINAGNDAAVVDRRRGGGHDADAVDDAVAEHFLEEESTVPVPGLDPLDRARFGRLVRQCASNWLAHPQAALRTTRGKYGMSLQFEGPMGGKTISVFSLRAYHKSGEYRFVGPNPDRRRLGLKPESLQALERMRDLYEALLSGKEGAGDTVVCVLNGERTPDLVPLVEETRRALDGGQDVTSPPPPSAAPPPRPAAAASRSGGAGAPADEGRKATPAAGGAPRITGFRLTCAEPKPVLDFWARVFKRKAEPRADGGGTVALDGATLSVEPDLPSAQRKALGYGSSKLRGAGLIATLQVSDFDLCLRRARRIGDAIAEEDRKNRRFIARDPAGFAIEIRG